MSPAYELNPPGCTCGRPHELGVLRCRRAVAFIPARGGSKRVPRKALRQLGGRPLIEWTIEAAYQAGLKAVVVTDDEEIARVAHDLTPDPDWSIFMRDPIADDEPDIVWVTKALEAYPEADPFLILRPTSPFRSAETITRALAVWREVEAWADSLRAVTHATQHPAKMWRTSDHYERGRKVGAEMRPVMVGKTHGVPWHSMPTQGLPPVYVQTAGLEIAHRSAVTVLGSIAGEIVAPFLVEGLEALDINDEDDFTRAEAALFPIVVL